MFAHRFAKPPAIAALILGLVCGGARAEAPTGAFVEIPPECRVKNTSGNCGFCAIETIGRYQGINTLHGFARGKGGCTSASMAGWLRKYGVEFEQATRRSESIELMRNYLAKGQPVLFSIPGHALVCCGWTKTADGREYMWVVDNSGSERAEIKGWPKAEWDRRFDGWVCALRPIFPLRPDRPDRPGPGPKPGPHVDPTPGTVPTPIVPGPVPGPAPDKLAEFEKRWEARLAAMRELAEKAAAVAGKAASVLDSELPRLQGAVDKAKELGLISAERADQAHRILDGVGVIAPKVAELENKVVEARAGGDTSRLIGLGGGGLGILGLLTGIFAFFRRPATGQAPGGGILSGAANLPQIPGTQIDDIIRIVAQVIMTLRPPAAASAPAQPTV